MGDDMNTTNTNTTTGHTNRHTAIIPDDGTMTVERVGMTTIRFRDTIDPNETNYVTVMLFTGDVDKLIDLLRASRDERETTFTATPRYATVTT